MTTNSRLNYSFMDNSDTHPNYPFMEAKDVFYGIEIECFIPKRTWPTDVRPTISNYSRPIPIPFYPAGWVAKWDTTISAESGYCPVEIVSPKLKGFDGIVQLVQVLDDLNQRGARVNRSCGLHIHIDGTHLDKNDIKKVIQAYLQFEPLFFGVLGHNGMSRYDNNTWCLNSTVWTDQSIESDRYQSLNLTNWFNDTTKTVEFRLFSGELDPEKVVTYAYMCMALVVRARNCTRIHKWRVVPTTIRDLGKKFVSLYMSKKINQIVPEYTPQTKEDGSLYQVLWQEIPLSDVPYNPPTDLAY